MRPPHSHTSPSSVSLSGKLLRQYVSQVTVRRHNHVAAVVIVIVVADDVLVVVDVVFGCVVAVFLPFLLGGGTVAAAVVVFVGRWRRQRHEEVNLAALEKRVGRDDNDLRNDAVLCGRGGWLLEHVLGVCLHDVAGLDAPTDLFHAPIRVHYAYYVECSTW